MNNPKSLNPLIRQHQEPESSQQLPSLILCHQLSYDSHYTDLPESSSSEESQDGGCIPSKLFAFNKLSSPPKLLSSFRSIPLLSPMKVCGSPLLRSKEFKKHCSKFRCHHIHGSGGPQPKSLLDIVEFDQCLYNLSPPCISPQTKTKGGDDDKQHKEEKISPYKVTPNKSLTQMDYKAYQAHQALNQNQCQCSNRQTVGRETRALIHQSDCLLTKLMDDDIDGIEKAAQVIKTSLVQTSEGF